jgi:hypothetical protein
MTTEDVVKDLEEKLEEQPEVFEQIAVPVSGD